MTAICGMNDIFGILYYCQCGVGIETVATAISVQWQTIAGFRYYRPKDLKKGKKVKFKTKRRAFFFYLREVSRT